MTYDLTIRNGTIATASDTFVADIGIRDGVIVTIDKALPPGKRDIDASGRVVLPGGIDSHCHVEQLSGGGVMCADDFYSATVSAAFGGTTTIVPFAAQHRGNALPDVIADYSRRAAEKAVVDYGFHLIVSDPTPETLQQHLPQAIRDGMTSFKVYMTYEMLRVSDYQLLDILEVANREGALVMIHAENDDMIKWLSKRLLEQGKKAPKYHAVSHDALAESEATNRAIQLSRLVGAPILLVHVAAPEAVKVIHSAQMLGAPIHGETCPQYLFLTAKDIDLPGVEGAKFCCSPPPRDEAAQEILWDAMKRGTLKMFSSDHAPYRFDESGKLPQGENTDFKHMANGVPGIEVRLPLLFSEGVGKGRITLNEFVALTSTNHARTYGMYPRKGTIAVGSDADIAIWDADRAVTISTSMLHDNVGYTPYEGKQITGWPDVVISRGRVVVENNALQVERGTGQFVARGMPEPLKHARESAVASPIKPMFGFIPTPTDA